MPKDVNPILPPRWEFFMYFKMLFLNLNKCLNVGWKIPPADTRLQSALEY